MGTSNIGGATTSSPIKSIQSGSASTAGTITITSVNTSKAVIMSFSTGSTGAVSVSGGMNGMNIGLNAANGGLYGLANPIYNSSDGQIWFSSYFSSNIGSVYGNLTSGLQNFSALNANNGNAVWSGWKGNNMSNANSTTGLSYSGLYNPVNVNAANGSSSGANFNNGTTSLTAAQYGAYLTNSTTITVTGPCQWQVVEYN